MPTARSQIGSDFEVSPSVPLAFTNRFEQEGWLACESSFILLTGATPSILPPLPAAPQKRKAKLGKGKQSAANATNTSFKARSIALPQQSISREKSREPVTRRHLSVDDLLGQLRHPNANVRKGR